MGDRTQSKTPEHQQFWQDVQKADGCWLWTGPLTHQGYGAVMLAGRQVLAHRAAYESTTGSPIPPGYCVDHVCGVRRCVNPAHLRLATRLENNEHRTVMSKHNKSGYRNVSWHPGSGKWRVQVQSRGRSHHVGLFDDLLAAAEAAAAKRAELYTFPDHPQGVAMSTPTSTTTDATTTADDALENNAAK